MVARELICNSILEVIIYTLYGIDEKMTFMRNTAVALYYVMIAIVVI